jgi:hypothetical protein
MTPDARLAEHAAAHHGVFRGAHARLAGLSRRQIVDRNSDGRWIELYRDVYRINGAPATWRGALLAACWAGGFRAVASRRSAAALHSLPGGIRDLVEITCPRWRRARHRGLVVHESKALEPIDITVVDGLPVTTAARTLFDLGAAYRIGFVELAVDNALRRGLVSVATLDATVRRLSRPGRPGSVILRRLVAARTSTGALTESEMETRLLQAIRAAGLPEPVAQFEVWSGSMFVARVDFAYPDARIAIEYDSDEHHTGRVAIRHDRSRRHELIAAGWLPIDIGPADLRGGGIAACAAISQALASRGRASRT